MYIRYLEFSWVFCVLLRYIFMQVTISNKICMQYWWFLPGYNNTVYLCGSRTVILLYAKVQVLSQVRCLILYSSRQIPENNFENQIWKSQNNNWKKIAWVFGNWNLKSILLLSLSLYSLKNDLSSPKKAQRCLYQRIFFKVTEWAVYLIQNFNLRILLINLLSMSRNACGILSMLNKILKLLREILASKFLSSCLLGLSYLSIASQNVVYQNKVF